MPFLYSFILYLINSIPWRSSLGSWVSFHILFQCHLREEEYSTKQPLPPYRLRVSTSFPCLAFPHIPSPQFECGWFHRTPGLCIPWVAVVVLGRTWYPRPCNKTCLLDFKLLLEKENCPFCLEMLKRQDVFLEHSPAISSPGMGSLQDNKANRKCA